MEHFVFTQMSFVRSQTLKILDGVTEDMADQVPEGFRNTIRWNLGHIYVVLERFAFQYLGLPLQMPEGFKEHFENGTSPLNRHDSVTVPSLQELEVLLNGQIDRIREALQHRLDEELAQPYTTSLGMTLATPQQFLSFSLYHEGMHVSVIKLYKAILSRS
ncbi:hypothetical protein BVG16_27190 [Paenibacillus selenitireducens]|uniref:DinB-like domain-containing protein n=1 Tax=Paenibacillus selenitireducens TaxID=1324314 RepID=A0A1T2X1L2_9BACL|nr:DinB family protein [Paenibacillus selenitireducens]OPA73771.1 hypothetical protein BVG16_27190 [Paenibacillus selenitireducens]